MELCCIWLHSIAEGLVIRVVVSAAVEVHEELVVFLRGFTCQDATGTQAAAEALRRTMALPSGVLGPADLCALQLLASILSDSWHVSATLRLQGSRGRGRGRGGVLISQICCPVRKMAPRVNGHISQRRAEC
jgi:hypothetical protein